MSAQYSDVLCLSVDKMRPPVDPSFAAAVRLVSALAVLGRAVVSIWAFDAWGGLHGVWCRKGHTADPGRYMQCIVWMHCCSFPSFYSFNPSLAKPQSGHTAYVCLASSLLRHGIITCHDTVLNQNDGTLAVIAGVVW